MLSSSALPAARPASCTPQRQLFTLLSPGSPRQRVVYKFIFHVIYAVLAYLDTSFSLSAIRVFHPRTGFWFCCPLSLLFRCVLAVFSRFSPRFGSPACSVLLFRAVFRLMGWASILAYAQSLSGSICPIFLFSTRNRPTISPGILPVPLPSRNFPVILSPNHFSAFQRQSAVLRFRPYRCSSVL